MSALERQRYCVLVMHADGALATGYWETHEKLEELPAAGSILYVRDCSDPDRQLRTRVHHLEPGNALPIAAVEEPRGAG
jgi:hypothetical protein